MTHSVLLHPAGTYLTLKPISTSWSQVLVFGWYSGSTVFSGKRNHTPSTVSAIGNSRDANGTVRKWLVQGNRIKIFAWI